jgi:sialate O-acetylesterase
MLDPAKEGGPFSLEISCDEGSFTIQDIYIGDVWLCSGQSNMEMTMDRLRDDFGEEWQIKDFPLVRQFKVPQMWNFTEPCDDITGGNWLSPSVKTLHEFSGVAWFFAKELFKKHSVPIGLVNTAWGGTPVESWMSREALSDYPEIIANGEQYADCAKREEIAKKTGTGINKWETELIHEDAGLAEKWQNPETDISAWEKITLPGNFSDAGLKNFCGVIWLAKDFDADASFVSQDIKVWLGTIIDSDTVYINGAEIGTTGYRYPPRKYVPSGLIKEGKNRIVIRVTCRNGEGGITRDKPFRIFTDNASVQLSGIWKFKTGVSSSLRPSEFFFQWQPMGNYNAMIAPVLKYPIKGVIWYQGESNTSKPHEYSDLFRKMIQDWRKKNNNSNLPFLFVQLPIFGPPEENNENDAWAIVRDSQMAALSLPSSGMAVALELGEWNDLHPVNKKDIGIRLFLAAEKLLFNANNTSPGPVLQKTEIKENGANCKKIFLYFNNCGEGLTVIAPVSSLCASESPQDTEEKKAYVSVKGSESQTRLPAEIEGKNVISIDISSVKEPQKILYAWAANPRDRQLFNSEGLPVIPFMVNTGKE